MKKIISIVCALLCVSLLLGACSKSEDGAPDGMKQASSDNVDYIMYVPENWKVDKSELYTSAFYSSADATSISAAANGVAADETVETWWDGFYEKFASVYSDCSEPESADITLGGRPGARRTGERQKKRRGIFRNTPPRRRQRNIHFRRQRGKQPCDTRLRARKAAFRKG